MSVGIGKLTLFYHIAYFHKTRRNTTVLQDSNHTVNQTKYPAGWKAIRKPSLPYSICTLKGRNYKISRCDFPQHVSE